MYADVGLPTRVKTTFDATNPNQLSDDGYPGVYLDQRHMLSGGDECETAQEMFWDCWIPALARKDMEPILDTREVVPYLNASRWVADCPECNTGIACWDRNPYGCCLACGRMFKVAWQLPQLRAEVMRLLAGRPEANRNWDAHKGETAEELKIQNVLMLGVPSVERNGLLMAENVTLPDEFISPSEYLDRLRDRRRP